MALGATPATVACASCSSSAASATSSRRPTRPGGTGKSSASTRRWNANGPRACATAITAPATRHCHTGWRTTTSAGPTAHWAADLRSAALTTSQGTSASRCRDEAGAPLPGRPPLLPHAVDLEVAQRPALVAEPDLLRHPARGRVARDDRGLHPVQANVLEGVGERQADRATGVAPAAGAVVDPVAERRVLP